MYLGAPNNFLQLETDGKGRAGGMLRCKKRAKARQPSPSAAQPLLHAMPRGHSWLLCMRITKQLASIDLLCGRCRPVARRAGQDGALPGRRMAALLLPALTPCLPPGKKKSAAAGIEPGNTDADLCSVHHTYSDFETHVYEHRVKQIRLCWVAPPIDTTLLHGHPARRPNIIRSSTARRAALRGGGRRCRGITSW